MRLAPHLEAQARQLHEPPLHWLAGGKAEGNLGRESVMLPACITANAPLDRVALAGVVTDPFTVTTVQTAVDRQNRACPSATHGDGQIWVREVAQDVNGRGDDVGAPVVGAWTILVDHCAPDYSEWVFYRQPCTFTPGEPHKGVLTGEAVWKRQRTVTAAGAAWAAAPVFVSTSCWTDPNPVTPVPTDWVTTTSQTGSVSCGAGYTGRKRQTRQVTYQHRQWPWDATPAVQLISVQPWVQTATTCRRINGNSGDGRNGNQGGGGWDVDGDRRADYDNYNAIPPDQKAKAVSIPGRDAIPGRGGNGKNPNRGPKGGIGAGDSDRGRG